MILFISMKQSWPSFSFLGWPMSLSWCGVWVKDCLQEHGELKGHPSSIPRDLWRFSHSPIDPSVSALCSLLFQSWLSWIMWNRCGFMWVCWKKTQRHLRMNLAIVAAGDISFEELPYIPVSRASYFLYICTLTSWLPYLRTTWTRLPKQTMPCAKTLFIGTTIFPVSWTKFCIAFVSLGNSQIWFT